MRENSNEVLSRKKEADKIVEEVMSILHSNREEEIKDEDKRDLVSKLELATSKGSLAAPAILAEAAKRETEIDLQVDNNSYYASLTNVFINAKKMLQNNLLAVLTDDDKKKGCDALLTFSKICCCGLVNAQGVFSVEKLDYMRFFPSEEIIKKHPKMPGAQTNHGEALEALEIAHRLDITNEKVWMGLSLYYRGKFGEMYQSRDKLQLIQARIRLFLSNCPQNVRYLDVENCQRENQNFLDRPLFLGWRLPCRIL